MADLLVNLPNDLTRFLGAGEQLQYDFPACEVGEVRLLPLDELVVEYFPMDPVGDDDPHAGETGSYFVKGVSLIASCHDYDPKGLLLWLPLDNRYGTWDPEHGTLMVFPPSLTWMQIAGDFLKYINAQWEAEGDDLLAPLIPSDRHPYNPEQVLTALPDIEEWYEGSWTRRGVYRDGVQIRYPKQAEIHLNRHLGQMSVTVRIKHSEAEADWSPRSTRPLSTDEWQNLQPWLRAGFWEQPERGGKLVREPMTIWRVAGFHDSQYHTIDRDFGEAHSGDDPVYQLGERLLKLAGLDHFAQQED